MLLKSGRRIHSNKWVDMSTTSLQINWVHELAAMEGANYWLGDLTNYENPSVGDSKADTISYMILNSVPDIHDNEERAINVRVQDAYRNLEADEFTNEKDDMESMSESYSDSKDSTY